MDEPDRSRGRSVGIVDQPASGGRIRHQAESDRLGTGFAVGIMKDKQHQQPGGLLALRYGLDGRDAHALDGIPEIDVGLVAGGVVRLAVVVGEHRPGL